MTTNPHKPLQHTASSQRMSTLSCRRPGPQSIFSSPNGTCIACQLSNQFNEINSFAYPCTSGQAGWIGPSRSLISAFDLSSLICSNFTIDDVYDNGFGAMRTGLCNASCEIYYIDVIIKAMGAGYVADTSPSSPVDSCWTPCLAAFGKDWTPEYLYVGQCEGSATQDQSQCNLGTGLNDQCNVAGNC
jgi:hypothetical protein